MSASIPLLDTQFDATRFPRKLNLGCGYDYRKDHLNVDLYPRHAPDVIADVRQLDHLPAGYYHEILANDVLEHLPRSSTALVLAHWNRLLQIEGILRLRVPSVTAVADQLRHRNNQTVQAQEVWLQSLYGTQAYTGDFHFTGFTPVSLSSHLRRAGFAPVELNLVQSWLFESVAVKVCSVNPSDIDPHAPMQLALTDEAFLQACYRTLLGREPDPSGYDYFLAGMRNDGLSRDMVIAGLQASPEYAARQSKRTQD